MKDIDWLGLSAAEIVKRAAGNAVYTRCDIHDRHRTQEPTLITLPDGTVVETPAKFRRTIEDNKELFVKIKLLAGAL